MQVHSTIRKLVLGALLVGASGTLSACVINDPGRSGGVYDDDRDYGSYPPARPRHGYRYGYPGGVTLIFDSGLGLYSVLGYNDYYYNDGYFYRWDSGYWHRARRWNNRWERCESRYWPRPIHHVHNNYYGHGRRPHHDWDRDGDRHHRGDHDGRGDRDGRGDHDGGSRGGHGGHADDNGAGDQRQRGEQRERGEDRERGDRYGRPTEQGARGGDRQRELKDELRERSRESDPVDHRRAMDEARRGEQQRVQREAGAREQAARREVERGAHVQRERGERQAAQQAEQAQRREAERARKEERNEPERSSDDDRGRDNPGGERGDDHEDVRGDRR